MTENEDPQIFKKRYKIIKKLGAGNFGTAYLVTDLKAKNESYGKIIFFFFNKINFSL